MKQPKKVGAIVLALCMCMSLCVTAFAATSTTDADDPGFSITIENSSYGKTYTAYKIFDVTYSDADEDGNVTYSYTVTSDSPWYELFTDEDNATLGGYGMPFEFTATTGAAEDGVIIYNVYNVTVGTYFDEGDTEQVYPQAYTDDEIIGYLNAAIATIASYDEETGEWTVNEAYAAASSGTGDGSSITINVDDPGYYFVTSELGAIVSVTTTDPNPTIIDKNPTISIEKIMLDDDGSEETAEADGMGEDVTFDVTASVPMIEGEDYVLDYTITDSMTNGLLIELGENDFYQGSDGKYYLSDDKINEWVTLYDGTGAEQSSFTGSVYNCSFELVGYDVYTDETTGEDVHTFSGFILTYYTYDINTYKANLAEALEAAGYSLDEIWSSYPNGWPDADQIGEDFDYPSEEYFTRGKYPVNASIEIKYSAHVSSLEGYENTNTVTLDHDVTPFNHPTPWNPTTGEQKFAKDYVYSWELEITKVDGKNSTPLAGATFTLESEGMKDVEVGHSWLYVPVSLLTDNTYTYGEETYNVSDFESTYYYSEDNGVTFSVVSEDKIFDENGNYNSPYSGSNLYHRILTDEVTEGVDTQNVTIRGTTNAEGKLYFEGLGTGEFVLTEIVAPDGYNLLEDPIYFKITWDETDGFQVFMGSVNEDGKITYEETSTKQMTVGYILTETIENNAGTLLPGTGGIGTTIFYIVGAILICGAVVVLVTRRRVNHAA